jgi:hypothetical protein
MPAGKDMKHVVLLGDSIFDNKLYVPGENAVIDQLNGLLDGGDRATLLAVDGSVTDEVRTQLKSIPSDCTHLFVSSGGNDAFGGKGHILSARTALDLLKTLVVLKKEFATLYGNLLAALQKTTRPIVVCTIYDSIPGLSEEDRTALSIFNDVIVFEAAKYGFPIIDLRKLCDRPEDYSTVSPIEPSSKGGQKIAGQIVQVLDKHDFNVKQSVIY